MAPTTTTRSRNPKWLSYFILAGATITALVALGATRRGGGAALVGGGGGAAQVKPAAKPVVEMVFALDTTGSMGGLIEGAKKKIWGLASYVAQGHPTPDLRVGLVAYRDKGDEYVTRSFDLDRNLDAVYGRLRGFEAAGGGDGPEHVAKALHDAVNAMSWTDRPEVVKVIYLVGDAPPHTDYDDGYDYLAIAAAAGRRGIAIHTIRCGNDPQTEDAWRRVATAGRGQFMTIAQNGGMNEERTRYDEELARLHDRLNDTVVGYGAAAPAQAAAIAASHGFGIEEKVNRAAYLGAKGDAAEGGDLVADVKSGRLMLDKLAPADLPAELRALPKAEQAARLEAKAKERAGILGEIKTLSAARAKDLASDELAGKRASADAFDGVARKVMKKSVADNALSGLAL